MLLLRAGEVTIARTGQDRYRRTLARLTVDGTDVGESLIREGFALPWKDGPGSRHAAPSGVVRVDRTTMPGSSQ